MVKKVARSKRKPAPRKRTARAVASEKLLVMIHGGGKFGEDWYKPLVKAIEEELGHPFAYLPVYYADVADRQDVRALETPEELKFKNDLQNELRQSFDAARTSPTIPSDRARSIAGLPTPLDHLASVAQEITAYFFNAATRAEMQSRLVEKLEQAKSQAKEIVIASLSFGTVICFDVLKQSAKRYPISYWFTTGSPIAKLRRVRMYDDNLGAITAQNVARWHNIYDTTDFVADPLGPAFPKPGYRLHDIFVNVGLDPLASHDYFNNRETIKLFADVLR
jgi:hypothetical protein